jgi:prevent-host-death family protein
MFETVTISATDLRRRTHDVIESVAAKHQPVAVSRRGQRPA